MGKYRRKYIVTTNDLVGDISNFPIEIVQKMVDCQVKQGNMPNVTVFQKNRFSSKANGGFNIYETGDGDLWSSVLEFFNFDLFFQKYPKKEQMTMNKFTKKDLIPGKHIVEFNNGKFAIVNTTINNEKYLQHYQSYSTLNTYDDNLVDRSMPEWTIKAVYELLTPKNIFNMDKSEYTKYLDLIWSRNVIKLNDILKAFNIPRYDNLIIELTNGDKIEIKVE